MSGCDCGGPHPRHHSDCAIARDVVVVTPPCMPEAAQDALLQAILLEKSRIRRAIDKPDKRKTAWRQDKENRQRRKLIKDLEVAQRALGLGKYA